MQVASQIFPFFEIPNWGVRLVVLLLVIGFPVAMTRPVMESTFCSSARPCRKQALFRVDRPIGR